MDTTIACLTPPGKAAIATLAVRGPLAWDITRSLFVPRKGNLPELPTAGHYWFGKLGKEPADEVILAVKPACVEIHCHGGVEVVRMLQELYAERGATIVTAREFIDDPLRDMLAHAPTTRTAAILLDQVNGAWARSVAELETLIGQGAKNAVQSRLQRLNDLIPLGQHLVEPWKIVIAGAPNVGKSSLMNALAGYTRSIVSPIPGTTRDLVTLRLAIDGWPVELTDTAGIRPSSSDLERQGIGRALDAVREADLRLWLLDGSSETIYPDDRTGWQFVINKIDLPAAWDWQRELDALRISAQTQAGLAELCAMVSQRLVPQAPAPGEAVPCLPEQREFVRREHR